MASEMIQAAIERGDVVASESFVEVRAVSSPTAKDEKLAYTKLEATNAAGMAALMDGKIEPATPVARDDKGKPIDPDTRTPEQSAFGVCDAFNYGRDLWVRQEMRQKLLASLSGPEKAVKSSVKGLLAAGFDADAIRKMLVDGPKFAGVDGISKLIDAALAS